MIITTTPNVENKRIQEYKGIVFGEVITGVNIIKDLGASLRDVFGGRSQGYEKELVHAREDALNEMEERAKALGANAVVGMRMDYEVLGASGSMLMVSCSGTAVVLED